MTNIIVQDVGAEKDAITSLRAPTHFGRPNWDRVFSSIAEKHPETDVGVVRVFYTRATFAVLIRNAVLLWPHGPLSLAAHHVEQVLHSWRHQVLLRKGYVSSLSLRLDRR